MKNILASILVLVISFSTHAESVCQQLVDFSNTDNEFEDLGGADILSRENWYQFDVIAAFGYDQCKDAIRQTLIEFNGKNYYRFTSHEDNCDGGNTYGAIYTEDLKTAVAHIYDGDIYCEEDFNEDQLAANHKCHAKVEALAVEKMKAAGFEFELTNTYLELRKPYSYSRISVEGKVPGKKREVMVEALVLLKSCEMTNFHISRFPL